MVNSHELFGLPEMVGRGSGEGGQQVSGKRKRRIENKKVNEKGGTVAAALSLRACLYTRLHSVLTVSCEDVSSVVTCFIK